MFKPWRDPKDLISGCQSYAEALKLCYNDIDMKEGIRYGEFQTEFRVRIENVFEAVQKIIKEREKGNNQTEDDEDDIPDDFEPKEAENAMADLRDAVEHDSLYIFQMLTTWCQILTLTNSEFLIALQPPYLTIKVFLCITL